MYNKVGILKSSYVSSGRPTHPKKTSSHANWFWLLEMSVSFKFLVLYIAKLVEIR